jgi:hypothetical protein
MIGGADGYQTAAHSGNAGQKATVIDLPPGVMTDKSKNYSAYEASTNSKTGNVSGLPVIRCMPKSRGSSSPRCLALFLLLLHATDGAAEPGFERIVAVTAFVLVTNAIHARHIQRHAAGAHQPAKRPVFIRFGPTFDGPLKEFYLLAVTTGAGNVAVHDLVRAGRVTQRAKFESAGVYVQNARLDMLRCEQRVGLVQQGSYMFPARIDHAVAPALQLIGKTVQAIAMENSVAVCEPHPVRAGLPGNAISPDAATKKFLPG